MAKEIWPCFFKIIMSSENIALIDLDGTVADYDAAMREALSKIKHPDEPVLLDSFHHNPPSWLDNRITLIRNQPGFWRNLKPIELGFHVISIFKQFDFKLMVLSKSPRRASSAWTEKADWAHEHIPDALVTLTEDKGLTYGKILFDDYPPYVERWLKWRPRGLAIMLASPLNKDFNHPNVFKYNGKEDDNQLIDLVQCAKER